MRTPISGMLIVPLALLLELPLVKTAVADTGAKSKPGATEALPKRDDGSGAGQDRPRPPAADRREGERAPYDGGCPYRERKLELIV